jgi:hypothetical protein
MVGVSKQNIDFNSAPILGYGEVGGDPKLLVVGEYVTGVT